MWNHNRKQACQAKLSEIATTAETWVSVLTLSASSENGTRWDHQVEIHLPDVHKLTMEFLDTEPCIKRFGKSGSVSIVSCFFYVLFLISPGIQTLPQIERSQLGPLLALAVEPWDRQFPDITLHHTAQHLVPSRSILFHLYHNINPNKTRHILMGFFSILSALLRSNLNDMVPSHPG